LLAEAEMVSAKAPLGLRGNLRILSRLVPRDARVTFFLLFSVLDQSGRKETALDLAKFVDKGVQVKLTGGRQG
jgi:hypothetical protein